MRARSHITPRELPNTRKFTSAEYEVIKNFPTSAELRGAIERSRGREVSILELEYYWCAVYRTGSSN